MTARAAAIFAIPTALAATLAAIPGFFWTPAFIVVLPVAVSVLLWLVKRSQASVLGRLDARPVEADEASRLTNVIDNLCLTSGLNKPNVFVVDEPSVNIATVAGPTDAIVVTAGFLSNLDALQMEGAVAHALTKASSNASYHQTLAASLPAPLVTGPQKSAADKWDGGVNGVVDFDLAAVGITRYPPGLRSTLEQIDGAGESVEDGLMTTAWLAPPTGARTPLEQRIEVLWEL